MSLLLLILFKYIAIGHICESVNLNCLLFPLSNDFYQLVNCGDVVIIKSFILNSTSYSE